MTLSNHPQILIIDHHQADIEILTDCLANITSHFLVASNSCAVQEILNQAAPALILLDSTLSQSESLETDCPFYEPMLSKNVPIIFMTPVTQSESIMNELPLHPVDYINKPLKREEVLSRVQLQLKLQELNLKVQHQNQLICQEIEVRTAATHELSRLSQELARVEKRAEQLSLELETLQVIQQEIIGREKQLQHNIFHDSLTSLPNRNWLIERLKKAISLTKTCKNFHYAVLSIDLDRFKVINDSLGHLLGDELLINVAARLDKFLKEVGMIARLGGDEFIVLLEDIDSIEDVSFVAECIQEQLKLPFNLNGCEIFTRASIGITLSQMGYESPIEVLRDAGIAMSQAKQDGKGCYKVLTPESRSKAIARLQLENDLRQAIEHQEFFLEYQPIYSLSTGQIKGFEALVRWQHPSRGRVSPAEFIPTVEEIGLIDQLGLWVLQAAAHQLNLWQQNFPHSSLFMNINLSTKQLQHPKFLKEIDRICQQINLGKNCLKLELTESCFLEISTAEIEILQQIRERGIGLCIDDFGTGYSSFGRLHSFPVDTIKVDRSFVQRVDTDSREMEIMQTIVNLAHNLGLDLVAEGIETPQQLQTLQELGYELGQGYLFSRPLSSEMATQLLWNIF